MTKIEQINDAFIEVLKKRYSDKYVKYIKQIQRELVANIETLTQAKVKAIIRNAKINIDDVVTLLMIQSAVLMTLNKPKKQVDENLIPILGIVGLYSLKKPKLFVEKMVSIVDGVVVTAKDKAVKGFIVDYTKTNEQILTEARGLARSKLDMSIIESNKANDIVKDFYAQAKDNKPFADIKRDLLKKYDKASNVERVLDTELHRQSEYLKELHAKSVGYTHKIWRTQRDSKVRDTAFHTNVANKRVPIDGVFRAGGLKADYPGDTNLPPSDSIHCRCYLEYE